jgi:hypothetical protein
MPSSRRVSQTRWRGSGRSGMRLIASRWPDCQSGPAAVVSGCAAQLPTPVGHAAHAPAVGSVQSFDGQSTAQTSPCDRRLKNATEPGVFLWPTVTDGRCRVPGPYAADEYQFSQLGPREVPRAGRRGGGWDVPFGQSRSPSRRKVGWRRRGLAARNRCT